MSIKEIIINAIRNPTDEELKKEILNAVATPTEIAKDFEKTPATISNLIEKENLRSIKSERISLVLKSDFYNLFDKEIVEYIDNRKSLATNLFTLILKPYKKDFIEKTGCEIGFSLLTKFNIDTISQRRVKDFKEESIINMEISDEIIDKYIEINKQTFTDGTVLEYEFNQEKFLKELRENNFKLAKNAFFSITFKASNIDIVGNDTIKESSTYFVSSPECSIGFDLLEKLNLNSYEVNNKYVDPINIKEYTIYINEETEKWNIRINMATSRMKIS